LTIHVFRSSLNTPLDRNPPAARLEAQEERRRSKDRKRKRKAERLESEGEGREAGSGQKANIPEGRPA